jgi:hypothetical protein
VTNVEDLKDVKAMSAKNVALLQFFAAVTFSTVACGVIIAADLGLDEVMMAWEMAGSVIQFGTVLRMAAPKFPDKEAFAMGYQLHRSGKTAVKDMAAASSHSRFVQRVAAAAAKDPSEKSIARAADLALKEEAVDVGKSEILRDVCYHGAELLSQPADDDKSRRKLKQASLAAGGTWRKHTTSERAWAAYTRRNVTYLLQQGKALEAQRLQVFDLKRPPVGQGGKEYLEEYFLKYNGFLEVEVDLELKSDAVASATKQHEGHFGQIAELVAAVQQVQAIAARVDKLEEGGSSNDGAPLKCGKCWQFGHSTSDCGLGNKAASQSRDTIKAARAAAAKARQEKEAEHAKDDA